MPEEMETLYARADRVMRRYIKVYLEMAQMTKGFTNIEQIHLSDFEQRTIVLGGIGSPLDPASVSPERVAEECLRMQAVPFEVERAITKGIYVELRQRVRELVEQLEQATAGFMEFDPAFVSSHPRFLPILQRLADIPSKAELRRRIGSASDNVISTVAAERLAEILNRRQPGRVITQAQLLQSIEPTLEGIVRDLVGKVLLESIVASALDDAQVPYKREAEYRALNGVVYDFRADFIIPDEQEPKAFVEVRKSSTRHASLYAKDKMFSAINWKGKNQELLAVLVVDGPWTSATLRVMAKVFDYIIRINQVSDVARVISSYINGDQSKLKWLIDFAIRPVDPKSGAGAA
jgi:hypothetical protein